MYYVTSNVYVRVVKENIFSRYLIIVCISEIMDDTSEGLRSHIVRFLKGPKVVEYV